MEEKIHFKKEHLYKLDEIIESNKIASDIDLDFSKLGMTDIGKLFSIFKKIATKENTKKLNRIFKAFKAVFKNNCHEVLRLSDKTAILEARIKQLEEKLANGDKID
tara:strand:+ start:704 stop:1021 length:318 start_codon:yes stop_codon:yes gene_type:complete